MAPNSLDIFEINDAFAVDDGPPQTPTSPSAVVMPQFLIQELEADADGFALAPAGLDPTPQRDRSPNPWDPRMIVDLALNIEPVEAILECYGIEQKTYEHLCTIPAFRRDLAVTMRELRENGLSYAKKAATQAEAYLLDVDDMIQDKAVPASTRLSAIQWVTKMGRLEPKEEKADSGSNGTTVNLQINFAT